MLLILKVWKLLLTIQIVDKMGYFRTCESNKLNTGQSACPITYADVIGAIIASKGVKLPAELTREKFEELCHADRPERIYPIGIFTNFAKNGGEPQVNTEGYGAPSVTGLNARTDTATMARFSQQLNAALLRTMDVPFDVYYVDKNNKIYGYNDGTEELADQAMSCIYPTAIPHPTDSAKASLTVSFCFEDPQDAMQYLDFRQLGFSVKNVLKGLTDVVLDKQEANKYKLLEKIGKYDLTPLYGDIIAKAAAEVLNGATSATYADGILTVVPADGGGTVSLKAPSVLFEKGIKYIEEVSA